MGLTHRSYWPGSEGKERHWCLLTLAPPTQGSGSGCILWQPLFQTHNLVPGGGASCFLEGPDRHNSHLLTTEKRICELNDAGVLPFLVLVYMSLSNPSTKTYNIGGGCKGGEVSDMNRWFLPIPERSQASSWWLFLNTGNSPGANGWSCPSPFSYSWLHQKRVAQLCSRFILNTFSGSLVFKNLKRQHLRRLAWPCVLSVWDFTYILLLKNILDFLEIITDAEPHFQRGSFILGSNIRSPDLCSFFKMTWVSSYLHLPIPPFSVAKRS